MHDRQLGLVHNSPMRVLTISDYVVKELYDQFDPSCVGSIDLILSCGDLPPEYLAFLRAKLDAPLYYILGNHDIRYKKSPPQGCVDVSGRIVREKGLRILGLSGSRWYNGGPNQYTEKQMSKTIRNLALTLWRYKGVDIIISHAPPRKIGDREDPCHRGFQAFVSLIEKQQPPWFVHGHIHALFDTENRRIRVVGKTQVINSYGHYVFDLESC